MTWLKIMKVFKTWIKYKPQVMDGAYKYQAVAVIHDETLNNPANGYNMALKTVDRMFKDRQRAKRWLEMVEKSVRSNSDYYPTVNGEINESEG